MSLTRLTIGEAAKALDVSAHTLRYYEKIGLIPRIGKDVSGHRHYDENDMARLRFIKRAQRMQFSLDEIRQLLQINDARHIDKPQAQSLVREKLDAVRENLDELTRLQQDLSRLLSACEQSGSDPDCPIIEGINAPEGD